MVKSVFEPRQTAYRLQMSNHCTVLFTDEFVFDIFEVPQTRHVQN